MITWWIQLQLSKTEKEQKNRGRQDLNLRGLSPMDFKSTSVTTWIHPLRTGFRILFRDVFPFFPIPNFYFCLRRAQKMWTATTHRFLCILLVFLTFFVAFRNDENTAELLGSVERHSSPIDWCEENHAVSPIIAEWWNTWSGVSLFPITTLAWMRHSKFSHRVEPRFAFCLVALTCVGLGSIYFHATLSKLGQVLDEITICWTNYYAILIVIPKRKLEARIGVLTRSHIFSSDTLITVILTTPIWGLFYPILSHILTVATIVLLPWAIISEFNEAKGPTAAKVVLRTALMFHGTAVTCWVLDRLLCVQITEMLGFYPQLHAFWHIFVFTGAYFSIVGIIWVVCFYV